ncbi:MAG: PAS domain S-box protein [Melioribacteraceae bacterium]
MVAKIKILFVEDLQTDVELAKHSLSKEGIVFQSRVVETEADFLHQLEKFSPDIIISDYKMPQFNGLQALNLTLEKCPATPFILLTGSVNEEVAVECMKSGATDYIIKEHIARLPLAVKDALEKKKIILGREKAEFQLIESEERFRSIYENSTIGLYRTNPAGKIILANPALIKMLGYSSFDELAKRNLQKEGFEPSQERKLFHEQIKKNGEVIGLESAWIKKDETVLYVRESARIISDANGKILFYDGTVENITARKKAEEASRESEDRYRNLVENSSNLICTHDLDGNLLSVNSAALKITGYSQEEVLNMNLQDIIVPEYRKIFNDYLKKIQTIGYAHGLMIIQTKTGERRIWEYNNSLRTHGTDKPIVRGMVNDITERKQAEERTKAYIHFLESLERIDRDIKREVDVEPMLWSVVNTVFSIFDCDRVWLFYPCDPNAQSFRVPVEVYKPGYPGANAKNIDIPMSPDIADNLREALELSDVVTYLAGTDRPINKVTAEQFGVQSQMMVPIYPKVGKPWVVGMHQCSHARVWTNDERQLFKEISRRVADSLSNLLMLQDLKASEESYRHIVEATNAVQYHLKYSTMKYHYIHNAIEKLIGYTPEELNEIGFKNIVVKISRYHVEKVDINLIVADREHGKTPEWQADYQVKTKDGRLIWLSDHSYPWKDETGNLIGSVGILNDITERKQAEEILSNERTLLRTIIDFIPDAIYAKDINGRKILANKTEIQLSGRNGEDEVIGKTDFDLYPENEAKRFNDEDQSVIHSGKPLLNMESSLVGKDGQIHWLLGAKVPLRDVRGEIIGIVGVNHDFTERKLAEEELLKLSLAVEQSPASVIITNLQGDIEYVNKKFCLVTGYSKEEAIGQNPRILKSGIQDQKFYEELWNTILSGREWQGEFLDKKKNGDLFWESALISPLVNKEGKITHFLAVKEDITDKKKMIEELIFAKEKAEEMNRLKSNFLANMSHELRTPLNGIMGYADILTSQLEEPELIEMSQGIFDSGKRLSETLNFILDLSEAETVKVEEVAKDIAVIPLVKNSIKPFSKEIAKRGLQLETIVKDENIYAHLEEHLFNRVLYNLLDNAIKFTKKGKISVEIGREVSDEKAWLYVKIKDTGIGIAPDKIDLIWDEFRQVSEGLSRSFEGAGLGLTISKKAVELMHGVIFVESELGVGSTFTVKFPAVSFLPQKEELIQTKDDTGFQSKQEKVETADLPLILCVEDDYVNSHIVKLYLKNICRVDTAESVEKALLLAAEKKYELILMDINLGEGVSGMEVVKEIVKMPQYLGTPIIAVTAYAMEKDKAEFLKGGCTGYISKPYQKEELIDLVTSSLRNN